MPWQIYVALLSCVLSAATSDSSDVRRSDDVDPMSDVVTQQSRLIEELRAKLTALETDLANVKDELQALKTHTDIANQPIAFSSCLASSADIATGARVKFTATSINLGGGYHATTSSFVAPVSGLYVFSYKVIGGNTLRFFMMKEGNAIAETETADSDSLDRAFVQTLVQLTAGQSVWVEKVSGSGTHVTGGGIDTCFYGFLLHRDAVSS